MGNNFLFSIIGFLVVPSIISIFIPNFLAFFRRRKKFPEKPIERRVNPEDYFQLEKDEKLILNILKEHRGKLFQSRLIKKTGFNKVKVSRILHSLEGKRLIERKSFGMSKRVYLKNWP